MNKIILIIVVILIVFAGSYFLLKEGYQASIQSLTSAPGAALGTVEEITVIGTEYAFSPSTITVQVGRPVKITFQNRGSANHNLIIEGLGVSSRTIRSGQTDAIEFTAPTSGTYTIFCSVPSHRASGMVGSLKVE